LEFIFIFFFDSEKGKAVADLIKNNKSLTVLFLSNCKLGNISGAAIGRSLKFLFIVFSLLFYVRYNQNLVNIDISRNEICDEGCIGFAEGLKDNFKIPLKYINIGFNNITGFFMKIYNFL
jgi:Ran GTPase-activating protein (RanGAP) involved in mRNA processing and transport